jgi:hypothetical protein
VQVIECELTVYTDHFLPLLTNARLCSHTHQVQRVGVGKHMKHKGYYELERLRLEDGALHRCARLHGCGSHKVG